MLPYHFSDNVIRFVKQSVQAGFEAEPMSIVGSLPEDNAAVA
jgi:hypothetical protein